MLTCGAPWRNKYSASLTSLFLLLQPSEYFSTVTFIAVAHCSTQQDVKGKKHLFLSTNMTGFYLSLC